MGQLHNFFVPDPALSRLYRARFRDAMRQAGLLEQIDPAVWKQDWVVKTVAVGDGRAALKYLSAYLFRVAIGDHRILSCEQGSVTFSYKRSGARRWRRMTLEAHEFLRRFLQHVLPRGFQKVRHHGFLSPRAGSRFESVRGLAALHAGEPFVLRALLPPSGTNKPPRPYCRHCGADLLPIGFLRARASARGRALFDTS